MCRNSVRKAETSSPRQTPLQTRSSLFLGNLVRIEEEPDARPAREDVRELRLVDFAEGNTAALGDGRVGLLDVLLVDGLDGV